jgi:hypothetical protein
MDELKINPDELDEIIKYSSRTLVGKICKRFSIISDKSLLQAESKELIHEEMRHLRDLIFSSGKGLHMRIFKLNSEGENNGR